MDYDPPGSKLMVAIHVPQGIWPGGLVFTPFDGPVAKYNLCNIIHMAEGCNDLRALNPDSLLEKEPTDVAYTSIWVGVLKPPDH